MFQWVELPALFTVARARVKAEKGGIAVGVCNVGEVAMGVGYKLRLAMFAARGAQFFLPRAVDKRLRRRAGTGCRVSCEAFVFLSGIGG